MPVSVPVHTAASFQSIPGLRHGFFDRRGGVSPVPRDSLCLARRDGMSGDELRTNWGRATGALGATPEDLVLLDQVHGNQVLAALDPTGPMRTIGPADGVVTAEPGLFLAIRTADCVPVLMVALRDGAPVAVGAAHAGWRGVVAGVVPHTVEALRQISSDAQVRVAIGPHASPEAYETGPEVIDAMVAAGLTRERVSRMGPRGREHADLRRAVMEQLEGIGVRAIDHIWACTIIEPHWFSHRRDGPRTGRQASVVGFVP